MINSRIQGSAHAAIVVILTIGIIGALGYTVWNNFISPNNHTSTAAASLSKKEVQAKEEYKTIKISDHVFRYPLSENNKKILIIPDESTPALRVAYVPIRDYYSHKDVSAACKDYEAGLVSVDSKDELAKYQILSRVYNKKSLEDALSDGTIVQVGERDLYLGGPYKQNEACIDIYESNDPELLKILSEVKDIRLTWLRSLQLSE